MAKHAVIYIFGLSDHRARWQKVAVQLWKVYGVSPSVFHMAWRTPGDFDKKIAGLLDRIDALSAQGYTVSLVGTSAGASVAMNVYALRQESIHRVVCICGKLRNPDTMSPSTFAHNPAFKTSLERLPNSLRTLSSQKLSRVLSLRPQADELVPPADTRIDGAESRSIPTVGHGPSIAYCITVYSFALVRYLKRP